MCVYRVCVCVFVILPLFPPAALYRSVSPARAFCLHCTSYVQTLEYKGTYTGTYTGTYGGTWPSQVSWNIRSHVSTRSSEIIVGTSCPLTGFQRCDALEMQQRLNLQAHTLSPSLSFSLSPPPSPFLSPSLRLSITHTHTHTHAYISIHAHTHRNTHRNTHKTLTETHTHTHTHNRADNELTQRLRHPDPH